LAANALLPLLPDCAIRWLSPGGRRILISLLPRRR